MQAGESTPRKRVELELKIGDVVRVGDQFLTVVDIENGEASFRIDTRDPDEIAPNRIRKLLDRPR